MATFGKFVPTEATVSSTSNLYNYKFLKDVLAKSLLFKALKSSKNIALFINPSLYTNYTSENSKNLSLLIYYLKTKFNFILNNEISYGNNRINIFTNKFIN